MKEVVKDYPYRVEVPMDNTYGLLFYSRLKLLEHEVDHLIDKEVPSIIADVEYRGRPVRLYGLHPTPPVPQENAESTERDAEVLIMGRKAKEYGKAAIVFGDLNDVAWSRTTALFLKTSGLLDPRRGRGMYNTFHAGIPLLRWPLDHYFVSSQFRLVAMRIERNVGSDHFPISLSVVLRSDDNSEEMALDAEEKQEVREKIAEGIAKGDA
jgi:endonuclease/exonuclease/phosphatase (EEP) superfamily protein YafD